MVKSFKDIQTRLGELYESLDKNTVVSLILGIPEVYKFDAKQHYLLHTKNK